MEVYDAKQHIIRNSLESSDNAYNSTAPPT